MKENALLINDKTLVIRNVDHPEFKSEIIHADGVQYSEDTPEKVLYDCCMMAGGTLRGNMDAARVKLRVEDYLVPFMLDPGTKLMAMPTHVANKSDNIWIFPEHILQVSTYTRKTSMIEFAGGKQIRVNCSAVVLNSHLKRAEQFIDLTGKRRVQSFMIRERKDKNQ